MTTSEHNRKSAKEDDDNDLLKKMKNYTKTETDELWQFLANEQLMVPKNERKMFNKGNVVYSEKPKKDKYSDSIDDYKTDKHDRSRDDKHENKYEDKHENVFKIDDNYHDNYKKTESSRNVDEFDNPEDERLAKLALLRGIGELQMYEGAKFSQDYSLDSDYKQMKFEYDLAKSIRDKKKGVQWMSKATIGLTYIIEHGNENFNPFDFHLSGWSTQVAQDQAEYYDIYSDLYEKYCKSGKPIPPEIRLIAALSYSAIQFHMAHQAVASMPSLADAFSQNPELAETLRQNKVSDHLKKQKQEQDTKLNNIIGKDRDQAEQRMADLNILRNHQMAHENDDDQLTKKQATQHLKQAQKAQKISQEMMQEMADRQSRMEQQEYLTTQTLNQKQRELDNMMKQLNNQHSESMSMMKNMYETIKTQPAPSNMQSQSSQPANVPQRTMRSPKMPASLAGSNSRPNVVASRQQENMRQQQIMSQKAAMKYSAQPDVLTSMREPQNSQSGTRLHFDDNESRKSSISINSDIDNIISGKINKEKNKEKIKDDTSIGSGASGASGTSIGSTASKRRKGPIKINVD